MAHKNKAASAEISGHVESIVAGQQFQFELAAKKGGRRAFVIEPSGGARSAAMAALVTAAYVAGKKIQVEAASAGEAPAIAASVRIGAKPKRPKKLAKKKEAAKQAPGRVKPPVPPAPEAPQPTA